MLSNSRGPETLADLVDELGPHARAATPQEAALAGDLVVVTVPFRARGDLPHAALAHRVVIDTMNYYPQRDGVVPELEDESTTSSEILQSLVPDAWVVKGFNNITAGHLAALARPGGDDDRSALAIAGDDATAKERRARGPRRDRLRHRRPRSARAGMAHPARHRGLRDDLRPATSPTGPAARSRPAGMTVAGAALRARRHSDG